MPINRRPARYLTSKRAHTETMTMLSHLHELAHENKQAQEFNTHLLRRIFRKVGKAMGTLDTLEAAVTRIEGTEASVVKLITDLADEIRGINNGPQAQALADRLEGSADRMAAAVAANPDPTPNEPPVEEPPVEPVP